MAVVPASRGHRPSSHLGSVSAAKSPHFSRLGDVEVNAGQNASFQCMATGRAAEAERFLLQVRGAGGDLGQSVCGGLLLALAPRSGGDSFLQPPAPCTCLASALPSWVPPLPQDRAQLQDPPATLHQRQSDYLSFLWWRRLQEPHVPPA